MKNKTIPILLSKNIFTLLVAIFFISLPLILDSSILKTNDMSGNIVNLIYIKKSIAEFGVFPQWNPFLNQGIPLVADPLNSIYNPLILLSFLLFPLQISIKLTYIISIFLSGLFMYILLKYLKISPVISLLASITFMSSGYLAARIYAGHLEKILSYPLVPLLLLSLLILYKKEGIKWSGIVALILTLFVFSGAIYETLYAFIILGSTIVLYIIIFIINQDKKYISRTFSLLTSCVLFLFFAAVKVLPLTEISTYILHVSDPFRGSQTLTSLLYNLFFPYNEFYLLLGKNDFNPNTPYFWWESYAFIGFIPFLCLFLIPYILKKKLSDELKIFSFLFFVIVIFSMLGSPLNPFTWLFNSIPFLQQFRIPSRIFLFLVPVTLTLSAIVLNYLYMVKGRITKMVIIALLSINLLSVFAAFSGKINKNNFIYSPPTTDLQDLLNHVKDIDSSYYLVGQSQYFTEQVPVYPAISNNLIVYNYNYGYILKKSYSKNPDSFSAIRPKYFILPKVSSQALSTAYKEVYRGDKGSRLFKADAYTAFADIYRGKVKSTKTVSTESRDIKNIDIKPNRISIKVDSKTSDNYLLVLESYAPGWQATVDDRRKISIIKNDFLEIPLERGEHVYTLTYDSKAFIIGLILSILSISTWIIYLSVKSWGRLLSKR